MTGEYRSRSRVLGPAWVTLIIVLALMASTQSLLAGQPSVAGDTTAVSDTTAIDGPSATSPSDPADVEESSFSYSDAVTVSGQALMSGDLYFQRGGEARRPGSSFMMTVGPRMQILGLVEVGIDAILSTDQAELRQNINQLGFTPTWRWVTLHLGDFSRNYSPYTVEGARLRGAGIDLSPGAFRFSIQGGRAQRSTAPGAGATVYKRNLIAARIGLGAEDGTHLNLTFLTARDDPNSEENGLVVIDTTLIDTIHPDLRPEIDTRPQENLAVGLDGRFSLFGNALTLGGEFAASLMTNDLLAEEVSLDSDDLPISRGVAGVLGRFQPIRLSSAFDMAYKVESAINLGGTRLRGGYEEVGPGFASLGLTHMMNDRRSYHMAGSSRLLKGRLGLNGQYRHQTNNLLGQRRNTVDRNTLSMSASLRPVDRLTTTLSGVVTSMINDAAPVDSAKLDTRSLALTGNAALEQELFGRSSVVSLGYNFQRTTDGNPIAQVPVVMTHNVTTSLQYPLSPTVSLSPSISGVLTTGEGMDDQHNIFIGFRGNGRFLDGDLRAMGNLTQTINQGRQIFSAQASVDYPLGWGTDISARARFNRYSAFNSRPGFQEALASVSISRSF